mgnify:CR=1 FL=1
MIRTTTESLAGVIYWMQSEAEWRDKIRTVFRVRDIGGKDDDWSQQAGYREWLGRGRRMWDEDMTNAIAVWDMVIYEVYSKYS